MDVTPSRKATDAELLASLSRQERQTLIYVAKGFTNNEISELMNLSTFTIADHLKVIFKKLRVDRRIEAAVMAAKNGWV